ncbi:hypothetical protein [Chryseobacterium indologenes]|uniref:hypothetical protein n=1 Tax=Chryseobacterium indologenes TaxID=253 RepID=UPI00162564D6|nr:hypothetical protein [Chryseobacterium indologenes]
MKLHKKYLEEIDKLEIIAQLQYEDNMISLEELNIILFNLFDKVELYKKNVLKISVPKFDISNYKNINVLHVTETLFCTG